MHHDMAVDIIWWDRTSICQLRSFPIVPLMPFWGLHPDDLPKTPPPDTIREHAEATAGLMVREPLWASVIPTSSSSSGVSLQGHQGRGWTLGSLVLLPSAGLNLAHTGAQ